MWKPTFLRGISHSHKSEITWESGCLWTSGFPWAICNQTWEFKGFPRIQKYYLNQSTGKSSFLLVILLCNFHRKFYHVSSLCIEIRLSHCSWKSYFLGLLLLFWVEKDRYLIVIQFLLKFRDDELATEVAWVVVYLSALSNIATSMLVKNDVLQLLVDRLATSNSLQLLIPVVK